MTYLPIIGAFVLALLGWLVLFDPEMFKRRKK